MTEVCHWFDACENTATGYVAHPDKGVIPACHHHITSYQLPVITPIDKEK